MNPNSIPKYSKVELLIRTSANPTGNQDFASTDKIEFEDCGLMITGDYLVVVIDERNDIQNSLTSTGRIFHMKDISAYRTHAQ